MKRFDEFAGRIGSSGIYHPDGIMALEIWATIPGSPFLLIISGFEEVRKKKRGREKTCRLQGEEKRKHGYKNSYKRTVH
ncbi:MAG: hypothetical protein ACRDIV_06420 [Ktedonobacteraceae bacterium]